MFLFFQTASDLSQNQISEFITFNSLATLSSCILAVIVIMNTTRHVFNWGPRWFGLFLSILISFVAWKISENDTNATSLIVNILLIVLNGCLIYTSAFGIQNTVVSPKQENQNAVLLDGNNQTLSFRSCW